MQIALISMGVGILFFLCAFLGFRQGLRLGMQTAKGQIPPKINPVGAVMQKAAETKQADAQNELLKGFSNMMNYNGDPPPQKD